MNARALLLLVIALVPSAPPVAEEWSVDPVKGNDSAAGTPERPLKSISAALARVADEVGSTVTIRLKAGAHAGSPLVLRRRTAPGACVALVGEEGAILDWAGEALITVLEGHWAISKVQIGTRRLNQRQGVVVEGPGLAIVRDVKIRTRSESGAGLLARRAGRIHLAGRIELNEDLHDKKPEAESFCRIMAEDHGTVQFIEREGASLSIGNGSLSAQYYGCVRLGCATARVTSWTMSNVIGIGNSGRVDLHGTETRLKAGDPRNTCIGPEDDGHIMAEDTKLILESEGNGAAIVLQKTSSLYGTDIELRGTFKAAVIAMSGSTFSGVIKGEVRSIEATTGAHVSLQPGSAKPTGEVGVRFGATIVLPDGRVIR